MEKLFQWIKNNKDNLTDKNLMIDISPFSLLRLQYTKFKNTLENLRKKPMGGIFSP